MERDSPVVEAEAAEAVAVDFYQTGSQYQLFADIKI